MTERESTLVGQMAGLCERKGAAEKCERVCVFLHMEVRGQPQMPFLWRIHF